MKYLTILLQAGFDASAGAGAIVIATLIFIGVIIGVFLIIRAIVLWYWKVDVIVNNQEAQLLQLKRDARVNYYKYMALGNNEKAYDSLLYIIFFDLTETSLDQYSKPVKYEELKKAYGHIFEKLGYEFPASPF